MTPLLERLESCPPFAVYYAARSGRRGPTPLHLGAFRNSNPKRLPRAQMVKDAGMSARTFHRLSQSISWLDFSVRQTFDFCRACKFEWGNVWALRRWMKSQMREGVFQPSHLDSQQIGRFNKLAAKWAEARRVTAGQTAA